MDVNILPENENTRFKIRDIITFFKDFGSSNKDKEDEINRQKQAIEATQDSKYIKGLEREITTFITTKTSKIKNQKLNSSKIENKSKKQCINKELNNEQLEDTLNEEIKEL